jgi:hypothetical protein
MKYCIKKKKKNFIKQLNKFILYLNFFKLLFITIN